MRMLCRSQLGFPLICLFASVCSACGGMKEPDVGEGTDEITLPAECADEPVPPRRIECTGLYSDVAKKKVAPNAREYGPAEPFWSDGLEKHRWVVLPKGEKIDASDPSEWTFPTGTKFFKEFQSDGKRLET